MYRSKSGRSLFQGNISALATEENSENSSNHSRCFDQDLTYFTKPKQIKTQTKIRKKFYVMSCKKKRVVTYFT
jgi:hypothetical protein